MSAASFKLARGAVVIAVAVSTIGVVSGLVSADRAGFIADGMGGGKWEARCRIVPLLGLGVYTVENEIIVAQPDGARSTKMEQDAKEFCVEAAVGGDVIMWEWLLLLGIAAWTVLTLRLRQLKIMTSGQVQVPS